MIGHLVERNELPDFPVGPLGSAARLLHGEPQGLAGVSLMLATLQPGEGPALHRHPYDEVFVLGDGEATFTIDGDLHRATQDQVVIVLAGVPHAFTNSGNAPLAMTAIHVAPKIEILWLESPWTPPGTGSV